jgi:CrcB protein
VRRWAAVAVGGALGTLVRHEITLAMQHGPKQFPWAIALVNGVGCLVVGAVMAVVRARPGIPDQVRLFVVVGLCGGLTTFSTWMVTDVLLVRDGAGAVALLDLSASLVGGVLAVWLAYRVTTAVLHGPEGGVIDVRDAD